MRSLLLKKNVLAAFMGGVVGIGFGITLALVFLQRNHNIYIDLRVSKFRISVLCCLNYVQASNTRSINPLNA